MCWWFASISHNSVPHEGDWLDQGVTEWRAGSTLQVQGGEEIIDMVLSSHSIPMGAPVYEWYNNCITAFVIIIVWNKCSFLQNKNLSMWYSFILFMQHMGVYVVIFLAPPAERQWSFSNAELSVVHLSVCPSVKIEGGEGSISETLQ